MPKYLFQASYTTEGVGGLLKEGGSKRVEMVADMISDVGGTLECCYYAFGEDDVIVIAELPDEETAISLSLIVSGSGAASVKTTVLIDPATIDAAVQKSADYRPPGSDS
ncbi:MAG: GYD domain-containing protein [Dehalococcoidia bacterium]|nr:GYD domain-containing protein [Dehalococcoidia bacterium]